jgi:lipopolysaccharide transport protein LptA
MKLLWVGGVLFVIIAMPVCVVGQNVAAVSATATAAPKTSPQPAAAKPQASPANKPKGFDLSSGVTGPITTEIYADESFFDSNKSEGIFRGRVKVNDPRFNLQADKLTVFISKGQNQGLEKAIAEGNVAMVRDRPEPNGTPSHAVGRADTAVYTAATGDVELKGTPRVQQGLNTHIGTSPDTVMVINQSGQLTTRGPSRTEIRQEPKENTPAPGKDENKSPSASPKP